jgi:small basic protein (TIGR04137 family)
LDRSLKSKASLTRHRNVLTRAQRIEKLEEEGRWEEASGPVFGLPKVKHRKSTAGGKAKKKAEAAAAEAAATPGAAPAEAAALPTGRQAPVPAAKSKEKARK